MRLLAEGEPAAIQVEAELTERAVREVRVSEAAVARLRKEMESTLIRAALGGTVQSVKVRAGDRVVQGQVLLRVSTPWGHQDRVYPP